MRVRTGRPPPCAVTRAAPAHGLGTSDENWSPWGCLGRDPSRTGVKGSPGGQRAAVVGWGEDSEDLRPVGGGGVSHWCGREGTNNPPPHHCPRLLLRGRPLAASQAQPGPGTPGRGTGQRRPGRGGPRPPGGRALGGRATAVETSCAFRCENPQHLSLPARNPRDKMKPEMPARPCISSEALGRSGATWPTGHRCQL